MSNTLDPDQARHFVRPIWLQTVCKGYQQTTLVGNFQKHFFLKFLKGMPSECQTVWTQIRPDILSGLIWVQTVFKGYQQTTLVGNFQNHFFLKISFRNTIRVSSSLDSDQARHFIEPDMGPNCLQRLSADNTSRQRVKTNKHLPSKEFYHSIAKEF